MDFVIARAIIASPRDEKVATEVFAIRRAIDIAASLVTFVLTRWPDSAWLRDHMFDHKKKGKSDGAARAVATQ